MPHNIRDQSQLAIYEGRISNVPLYLCEMCQFGTHLPGVACTSKTCECQACQAVSDREGEVDYRNEEEDERREHPERFVDPPVHISKIIPSVMEEICTPAPNAGNRATAPPVVLRTGASIVLSNSLAAKEAIKMAALPSVNLDTKPLEQKYQPTLTGFAAHIEDLNARVAKHGRITGTIAAEAQELDTAAKRVKEAIEAETDPTKNALFTAHRNFTALVGRMLKGPNDAREFARRLIGTYQMEQQRKADAERREAERLAREEGERARQAEVDELARQAEVLAQDGHAEEAAQLLDAAVEVEKAPVIPIIVPEVAPARVEGASVSYKLVGTVTEDEQLLEWMLYTVRRGNYEVGRALIKELMSWNQSGINAALKRGLTLPGVDVVKEPIVRNLSRR